MNPLFSLGVCDIALRAQDDAIGIRVLERFQDAFDLGLREFLMRFLAPADENLVGVMAVVVMVMMVVRMLVLILVVMMVMAGAVRFVALPILVVIMVVMLMPVFLIVVIVMMVMMMRMFILIFLIVVVMMVAGAVGIVAFVVIVMVMMMVRLFLQLCQFDGDGAALLHGLHQLLAGELVDNETAVQNLRRLAESKGCSIEVETISDAEYRVTITAAEGAELPKEEAIACTAPAAQKKTVVVISTDHMGEGNEELGRALLKAFLFALTQQETLPAAILFYNAGAAVTCEGSASLEDLQALQSQGVEILTCGTCLNYYGLTEKLRVGEVTNMYVIAEKQLQADCIIRP